MQKTLWLRKKTIFQSWISLARKVRLLLSKFLFFQGRFLETILCRSYFIWRRVYFRSLEISQALSDVHKFRLLKNHFKFWRFQIKFFAIAPTLMRLLDSFILRKTRFYASAFFFQWRNYILEINVMENSCEEVLLKKVHTAFLYWKESYKLSYASKSHMY